MDTQQTLKDKLVEMMEEKDWTGARLARKSGLPVKTVYRILTGETTDPSQGTRMALASAFNKKKDFFIEY